MGSVQPLNYNLTSDSVPYQDSYDDTHIPLLRGTASNVKSQPDSRESRTSSQSIDLSTAWNKVI